MKKTIKYISLVLFAAVAFVFSACEKETKLPPREVSPEVAEIVENYTNILVQSQQGWILAYKPDQYEETIYFHLTFQDGEKLDAISGYRGYHTLQSDVAYYYEGDYIPVIVFSGENVFSELSSSYNGSYKFKIYYNEDQGTFELVRSDGFDDKRFELTRANENNLALLNAQIDDVLAQIAYEEEQERLSAEVRQKVKDFVEIESDFYFYNLTVGDFSAAINSFDTIAREISLTYKQMPTSASTTVTVGYTLTPDGIVLNPGIGYGTVSIELLELGELLYEDPYDTNKATAIEIVANSEVGTMGYAHVAPYDYTLTSDRTVSTVDWLLDPAQQNLQGSGTGLFMYTAHADAHYSSLVNHDRWIFADYFDQHVDNAVGSTRLVNQLYFPENPATSRNIQISTHRDPSPPANLFFLYRINIGKIIEGSSALSVTLTETTGGTTTHKDAFDAYLNPQFPEEGVTVAPVIVGTTLRFRLISRKDSRYWVEYVLNRAADRLHRFD